MKLLALIFMCMLPLLLSCGDGGDDDEADVTPPSVPTGLIATAVSSSQIDLSWTASTDSGGVAGYKVYRDGVYLKSVTTTSTSDTELSPNTQYCYTVSAYDAANNESAQSSQACATTVFSTADIQGTWNWQVLTSGDAPQWTGWSYGKMNVDASGNATFTEHLNSNGETTLPSPITVSVSSERIVTSADSSLFHGIMNQGKDLVVATRNDGGGGYSLIIMQKTGGTFSTADLQGTWNWHMLFTGDAPQVPGWAYGLFDADVNGYATTTVLGDSFGGVTMSPTTFSVSSDGIVTTLDPLFHGVMNQDKDLIVGTSTSNIGYVIIIGQKIGGTFTTSDLQGNWLSHALISGDAPAQRVGWFYKKWSSDADGNFTPTSYFDSTGLTTVTGALTLSISSNGAITSSWSWHGAMNQGKNMIVFTFTGYPGGSNGVGGYALGVMLK